MVQQSAQATGAGLGMAVLSAATFGTSGSFASSLISAGWSPAAAVTVRVVLAALVLTPFAAVALRGRWRSLRASATPVLLYGVVAVGCAQLCFFNAVQRLSVGVALLLEYLGVLLVVGWMWLRHGQRPRRLTVAGAAASVLGLAFVLDLTGHALDLVGVAWGLGAAIGLAAYFVLSADTGNDLPPIAMAWAGLVIGGATLLALDLAGVLPLRANFGQVHLLHYRTSWLVPVLGLSLIAAALAYVCGIEAARRLGATVSSFAGLSEVLFAVLFAWLLLGQLPRPTQLVGGLCIISGVVLVRLDELRARPARKLAATAVEVPLAGVRTEVS